ncbi:MAG: hypothetical protein U9R56_01295 [candidate division Zixibacteria bacterium]|nr:hypothetical protein [candidate division Zixibacteria bacterium]
MSTNRKSCVVVKGRDMQLVRSYVTMGLMAISAVLLSASIVVYFNRAFDQELLTNVRSSVELAAITLMPYMISAAVAAITAVGIVTILPHIRTSRSLRELEDRLREMACGDLSSILTVNDDSQQIRLLTRELNSAIGRVSERIAGLKIVNRRQWDLLESIRQAAMEQNCDDVLFSVEQMENNWKRIADIEKQLIT